MRLSCSCFKMAGIGLAILGLNAQTPESGPRVQQASTVAQAPGPANEIPGLPPRAAPTDYPAQTKLGAVTIAAEFAGHGIPTPEAAYSTEDYAVVEVGIFGPPGTRPQLSFNDFALRINGKKNPARSEPFEEIIGSVKDPNWLAPKQEKASSTTIGGSGNDAPPPPPPKMPPELQRAMAQRVRKASLVEGARPLPQAGLLYFSYGGKVKSIHSLELIYNGPLGKASLDLEP
jgi:hypothetical protein